MRHGVRRGFGSGDFTVSWVALGMLGREAEGGHPRRFPQSSHVPSEENPANRPRPQTMPECRFNKYNAASMICPLSNEGLPLLPCGSLLHA
jgi:hypothetical protein